MKNLSKYIYISLLIIIYKSIKKNEKNKNVLFLKKIINFRNRISEKEQKKEITSGFHTDHNYSQLFSINSIFKNNININSDSFLLFEMYPCHYECTPGFSKYLIDLGFKVDVIMHKMGKTTFCNFEPNKNIRLFCYESIEDLIKNEDSLRIIFNKYKYLLIETSEPNQIKLYEIINSLKYQIIFEIFNSNILIKK